MNVDKIIIHHSASTDGKIQNWGQIRRYHVDNRGWSNIGYHYGIELVGYDYEILVGRWENENGAHCPGQNKSALGICLVGNFELSPVPARQWQSAIKLVRQLCVNHDLTPDYVYKHSNFKATACPGKYFDLEKFKDDL
jgi:N-acetyl-anhydromuramyl-L-alanine amidase AmpD